MEGSRGAPPPPQVCGPRQVGKRCFHRPHSRKTLISHFTYQWPPAQVRGSCQVGQQCFLIRVADKEKIGPNAGDALESDPVIELFLIKLALSRSLSRARIHSHTHKHTQTHANTQADTLTCITHIAGCRSANLYCCALLRLKPYHPHIRQIMEYITSS